MHGKIVRRPLHHLEDTAEALRLYRQLESQNFCRVEQLTLDSKVVASTLRTHEHCAGLLMRSLFFLDHSTLKRGEPSFVGYKPRHMSGGWCFQLLAGHLTTDYTKRWTVAGS